MEVSEAVECDLESLHESLKSEEEYVPSSEEQSQLAWLALATNLPGKSAVRLAVLILQLAEKHGRKRHLLITPCRLADSSISRVAGYEGLVALEVAGLVEVNRCRGRNPLVSILETRRS